MEHTQLSTEVETDELMDSDDLSTKVETDELMDSDELSTEVETDELMEQMLSDSNELSTEVETDEVIEEEGDSGQLSKGVEMEVSEDALPCLQNKEMKAPFKVGDEFSSFNDFKHAIDTLENIQCINFWK